jgi:patatin-like phospholipase/acyl hydrolase
MSDKRSNHIPGGPRSAGAISQRRIPQAWPKDRRFRILSIDGGGIKGIFPATVLAELERRYTAGRSIAACFDLVAGTSTGGILGLGLGAGYSAVQLADLYVQRGSEVFPPTAATRLGRLIARLRDARRFAQYIYDPNALQRMLADTLGQKLFGESQVRLCIPSFEGKYSEVFVYKTPHHDDYQNDRYQRMVTVGMATAAAPTYFRPVDHGEYTLVDGGLWANNPVILAVIEALTCFDISRDQIDVLSIGCGDDKFNVDGRQITWGGSWFWKNAIEAAMRLQSLAATNQARLLLGPPAVVRIDAPTFTPRLRMDDWRRSVEVLPPVAIAAVDQLGDAIAAKFLASEASLFVPTRPKLSASC